MTDPLHTTASARPEMLGGHPALDILNTVARVNGKHVDSLKSGNDVLHWLDRAGWPLTSGTKASVPPRLLGTARMLRKTMRALVEKRKAERPINIGVLNSFLAECESHLQLVPGKHGALQLNRNWHQDTAEQVLGPLAEAAAELLSEGDFTLIRQCKNDDCQLWFYDHTRSHRRRWCSMATCGNRHKVATFRRRRA